MKTNKLVLLFFIGNLLISSFYLDSWFNPNSLSRALTSYSIVNNGNLQIDDFQHLTGDKCHVGEHYYSEKAPFPALLVTPMYYVVNKLSVIPDYPEAHFKTILILGSFLCGSLPFSIILSLLFLQLLKTESVARSALLSMLPFYGSFVWIFAGTFFSHLFSGFLLFVAYLLLKNGKRIFLSGLISGLAFLSEFPVAVIIAVWAAILFIQTKSLRNLLVFSLGVMPSIVFILFFNYLITGNALTMLYTYVDEMKPLYGLGLPRPRVIYELLFSQYRGLLFYMPIFIVLVFAFIRNSEYTQFSFYNNYLILPCLAYFLVFSSYHDWWGGWTYGPRQLVPVAILLTYEGVLYLSKHKISNLHILPLSFLGLSMAFLAKSSVMYSLPTKFQWPFFEVVIPNFRNGNLNDANILTYLFKTDPAISAGIWLFIFFFFITLITYYGPKLLLSRANSD